MTRAARNKFSAILPKPLAILLAVFFGLALFYSVIIPLYEGPDEDDHFRYAKFLADQRALPVQLFETGGGAAGHQGWQPPLYYALAALVVSPIDASDYAQHLWRNYAVTFVGDPACCGRNIYYHTDSENFPYAGTTLAVHLARLLSILFGAVTVAATYWIAATVLGASPSAPTAQSAGVASESALAVSASAIRSYLPLAAAAVVAFNPSFLFASALVSNDALLAALSALVLLEWVRLLHRDSPPDLSSAARLGFLLALAALTKSSAVGLTALSALLLLAVAWQRRTWRFAVLGNAAMLAVVALVAGWWFVRNLVLYGDPLAYRLMTVSALFPRAGPLTLPELLQISFPWMWQTFWGGPTPGDMSPAILVVLAVFTALAALGALVFFFRPSQYGVPSHAPAPGSPASTPGSRIVTRLSLAFLAAWLALILVAQIQFITTTTGADQGRYLFPAISAIALFIVVGLYAIAKQIVGVRSASEIAQHQGRPAFWVSSIIVFSMLSLALFVPFAYTLPAYASPPLASAADLARVQHPLSLEFANQIALRGYDLDQRSVLQGNEWRITLYWQALAPMPESYRVFVHLVGADNYVAGGTDVIPGRGAFPTVYWKPGDALRDVVAFPVAANAPPGKYSIEVGLYPVGRPGERLTIAGSGDDRALVDAIKIAPREPLAYSPRTPSGAVFADEIDLLGYDAQVTRDQISLVFYWKAHATVGRDYTVFVHVLDPSGNIIAQSDRQPQNGDYPTSIWSEGDEIRDEYHLAIPANSRASGCTVQVGLYRPDSGARLNVASDGKTLDHLEFFLTENAQ